MIELELNNYRIPQEIVYGFGTLEYLRQVKGTKALIVTDKQVMSKYGFLQKTTNFLQSNDITIEYLFNVQKGTDSKPR